MLDVVDHTMPNAVPITNETTLTEVQAWLHTHGFDGSSLSGVDGEALFAMSEDDLSALTDEGVAIYIALHGVRPPNDTQ